MIGQQLRTNQKMYRKPTLGRPKLFQLTDAIASTPQISHDFLKTCITCSKLKTSGRNKYVRVTYGGTGKIEKLNIDETLKGNLRLIEASVMEAVQDARKKILEEKWNHWNAFFGAQQGDTPQGQVEQSLKVQYDDDYDPDETSIAPEIFDEPICNLTIAMDKANNMKKFFEDMVTNKVQTVEFLNYQPEHPNKQEFEQYRQSILESQVQYVKEDTSETVEEEEK